MGALRLAARCAWRACLLTGLAGVLVACGGENGVGNTADRGLAWLSEASAKAHPSETSPNTPSTGAGSAPFAPFDLAAQRSANTSAEGRLIGIYQAIGQGRLRQALQAAEQLVRDHPNFQLAQLTLGDLLLMQTRPVTQLGDVPNADAHRNNQQLGSLREESRRRIQALLERPPEGSLPAQFLSLSRNTQYAIAIDASRSRLYLFENLRHRQSNDGPPQLRLLADFYISVGLAGIEKQIEGDKRTPLGVYHVTDRLLGSALPDLYGAGALPISYPNALDLQRGKTGSGIWLHGTPRSQFVRAPLASDGCVVLSNPDMDRLLATVGGSATPVVIAPELQWVQPESQQNERLRLQAELAQWLAAKNQADPNRLKPFYSKQLLVKGMRLSDWWPQQAAGLRAQGPQTLKLQDLALLKWEDQDQVVVAHFDLQTPGKSRASAVQQYWRLENGAWKIFYERNT